MEDIEKVGYLTVKHEEGNAKTFIRLVMIAVSWVLFYSIIIGLLAFGVIAHSESDRCVKVYNEYLQNYSGMTCYRAIDGNHSDIYWDGKASPINAS